MAYHIPKTKVPPWFAVHVGSVVETVGAKIQPFFHSNTIFFNIFFITFIITRLCHCLFFKLILPSHRYFSKFNPFFHPNRSLGNRKLRSNCRIVQRMGISPAPYLVQPTRPALWSGNDPPSLRRGAVQSCIVIVSL